MKIVTLLLAVLKDPKISAFIMAHWKELLTLYKTWQEIDGDEITKKALAEASEIAKQSQFSPQDKRFEERGGG